MNFPNYIIIYPYKFQEFTWNLYELDNISEFCDVLVIDVSQLLYKNFSDKLSSKYFIDNRVIKINTYKDFRKILKNSLSNSQNITILNEIPWNNFNCFVLNLILLSCIKNIKVKLFDVFNGGVPFHLNTLINNNNISNLIISKLLIFVSTFLNKKITHRLVAGDRWNDLALTVHPFNIKLVLGHSNDFSNYLIKNQTGINSSLYPKIVLLDSAGPAFISDAYLNQMKVQRTTDIWYPLLVNFFNILEKTFNTDVEIAGHYKSLHEKNSSLFGERLVKSGETNKMIQSSLFVITVNSTAISYAIIYNKPIIFIYSNQLLKEKDTMNYINNLSKYLGTKPINLDNLPSDFSEYLNIDKDKYSRYIREVLTSNGSLKPNYKIIIEKIISDNY
jgi:hypothetical protein